MRKKEITKSSSIFIRISEETHEELKVEAARQCRTMSNLVAMLIENYLKKIRNNA